MIQSLKNSELSSSIVESKKIGIMQLEKIKPADRVTFLLNYLYLTIRNNQLLRTISGIDMLQGLFAKCLEQYVHIMSDWVTRGELNDPNQEFFIKANDKVTKQESKHHLHHASSKQ